MSDAARILSTDVEAIGWSVAMGLVPGYVSEHDDAYVAERRHQLILEWRDAMDQTMKRTGFLISAVMTDAKVVYPLEMDCPLEGESAVLLSGSSNPSKVSADRFDDYVAAVEDTIQAVRAAMQQNSVRIEFTRIARSTYFRADGRY